MPWQLKQGKKWSSYLLTRKLLIDLISKPGLNHRDKLLLCLAVDLDRPKSIKELKTIAINAGLREAKNWNVSVILNGSREFAVKTDKGWELTSKGVDRVGVLAKDTMSSIAQKQAITLREQLANIKNPKTLAFVEEAIKCFEIKAYRAAVVLSWIGAISLLYDYIILNRLATFNTEAKLRNLKWKDARTNDDLTRMKEQDFLDILQSSSIIGKNVKQQLDNCLKLRNGCGHPNTLEISENTAAAHIEMLILNVFSKF